MNSGCTSPVSFDREKVPRLLVQGLSGKLLSEAKPATTGASAAGICGSLALAQWSLPFTREVVNLRSEDLPDQTRRARKLDHRAARRHLRHLEALRRKPIGDGLNVGIRRAKLLPKLLGREPLVKSRRGLHLLVVEQLAQGGFLVLPALQNQQHALHCQVVRRNTLVKFRPRPRVDVSSQGDEILHVHGLRHTDAHGAGLRQ